VPLKTIAPLRLYQQVAEQIAALIADDEYAVGARLPAERDLALSLGVSRPVVREAMIALELAGIVGVRMGSGAFVVRKPARDGLSGGFGLSLADLGPGPLALVEAREAIECEVAARAAVERSEADLAALAAAIAGMRASAGGEAQGSADRDFHVRLAEATGNAVLVRIVDQLWRELGAALRQRPDGAAGPARGARDAALAEHEAILAALAAGDPVAARGAMRAHLASVRAVLTTPAAAAGPAPGALPEAEGC